MARPSSGHRERFVTPPRDSVERPVDTSVVVVVVVAMYTGVSDRIEYVAGSGRQDLFPDAQINLCDVPCQPESIQARIALGSSTRQGRNCDRDTYTVQVSALVAGCSSLFLVIHRYPSSFLHTPRCQFDWRARWKLRKWSATRRFVTSTRRRQRGVLLTPVEASRHSKLRWTKAGRRATAERQRLKAVRWNGARNKRMSDVARGRGRRIDNGHARARRRNRRNRRIPREMASASAASRGTGNVTVFLCANPASLSFRCSAFPPRTSASCAEPTAGRSIFCRRRDPAPSGPGTCPSTRAARPTRFVGHAARFRCPIAARWARARRPPSVADGPRDSRPSRRRNNAQSNQMPTENNERNAPNRCSCSTDRPERWCRRKR